MLPCAVLQGLHSPQPAIRQELPEDHTPAQHLSFSPATHMRREGFYLQWLSMVSRLVVDCEMSRQEKFGYLCSG